jgi:hypothetical protein
MDWSEIELSSILFHSSTCRLRWIHLHPNKPIWFFLGESTWLLPATRRITNQSNSRACKIIPDSLVQRRKSQTKRPRPTNSCVYNYWLCLTPAAMSHTADTDRTIRRRSIGSRGSTTRTECRKFFLCAHGREEPKWSERWWTRSDHDPERAHACVYSFYPWSAAGTAFSVGLDHVHLHYITPAGSSSSSEQWFWCSVLRAGTKELGPIVFTQMHQHPQQHCLWQW